MRFGARKGRAPCEWGHEWLDSEAGKEDAYVSVD